MPDWDGKLVLSFHKYWNRNDNASIDGILKLREATGRPIWLGESGENSNAWYRDAIKLVERHKIGWAWWPLKKLGFNNPLEVVPNPGWKRVVAYLTGKGPMPTASEARAAMLTLANHDIAYANNIVHPDVIDAMFRQPHDGRAIAFKPHRLRAAPQTIAAVDYDFGPPGVAYVDRVDANYHVATGGERVEWNDGRTYRNDGVDIALDAEGRTYVTAFEAGEWMQYTIDADRQAKRIVSVDLRSDAPAELTLSVGGNTPQRLNVAPETDWHTLTLHPMRFRSGDNRLKVTVVRGKVQLRTISVR
jgi:endoglucanase